MRSPESRPRPALYDGPGQDPADAAQAAEIGRLILRLPPDQREVVVLKLYEEMTFSEIARVVKARPDTVASRYRYALEKLRCLLGSRSDDR